MNTVLGRTIMDEMDMMDGMDVVDGVGMGVRNDHGRHVSGG